MAADELSRRALNRAYLARQLLLERAEMAPLAAVEHLVGLQAQSPWPPYFGLWSRLAAFDPHELGRLLAERRVVRITTLRGTIHMHSDRDALPLRRLTQPVIERGVASPRPHRPGIGGMDVAALLDSARPLLEEGTLTLRELGERLQERWPGRDGPSMAYAVHALVPVVQIPPRAVWGQSGPPVLAPAASWLAAAEPREQTIEDLVLRYLAAFGPASVKDIQAWSGLTRLKEVAEALRPQLRTFRDEQGAELFDVPGAPLPGEDVEAPVRFLPEFDNATLSHADRTRIVPAEYRRRLTMRNGMPPGTFLAEGFVAGMWRLERAKDAVTLRVQPFRPLTAAERDGVEAEGRRLADFAEPGAERFETEFAAPG